ncbi:hypothetical protein [Streptomyces sp. NPDC001933]|uniref:hypothetical protein n=1 Tax=Streptomyces sp. NPDC001933 TaxID=3364626 RepID=UPI0036AE71B8
MNSVPLAVTVSGANMHDSLALKPLIRGIPARQVPPGTTAAPIRHGRLGRPHGWVSPA